jgi:hypothetical protein
MIGLTSECVIDTPRNIQRDCLRQEGHYLCRSRIYCGWVKSGSITARGTFEALSEEILEKCQDMLRGRVRAKTHRQPHQDWPLRRFVLCGMYGKPLTSGWSKNSKGKRYGYYFCEEKGCRAVKGR